MPLLFEVIGVFIEDCPKVVKVFGDSIVFDIGDVACIELFWEVILKLFILLVDDYWILRGITEGNSIGDVIWDDMGDIIGVGVEIIEEFNIAVWFWMIFVVGICKKLDWEVSADPWEIEV